MTQYTKLDVQRFFENVAKSLPRKPSFFDPTLSQAEHVRKTAAELISFIEGNDDQSKAKKLFSGLVQLLLLTKVRGGQDMWGFFNEEKKAAAARARSVRATSSKTIDSVIHSHLSKLYHKKPNRRGTDNGAATEILDQVNSDLRAQRMKPLGHSALTKRIRKMRETSG